MVDGYQTGNSQNRIPISNGTRCNHLNADMVDGYQTGNASGEIPINNGTVCNNLNADKVDGYDAQRFGICIESSIRMGTSSVVATLDDHCDGLFIRFGDNDRENGVVLGQYANGTISGIRINTSGNVSSFHVGVSGTILDTGDFRLYWNSGRQQVVLYNDGLYDWCDFWCIKGLD